MNFNFKLSGKHAKYVILFTTLTCKNITQFSQGMKSLLLFKGAHNRLFWWYCFKAKEYL